MKKWGDHLEKKFIIDNVVQAVIQFKDGTPCGKMTLKVNLEMSQDHVLIKRSNNLNCKIS